MRTPEYLSPSSISLFYKSIDEFYIKYLADNKSPRMKQTQPMSVGSAFDAYVKAYLTERLYGKDHKDTYDKEELLREQVEEQNLDWARENGKYVFNCYKRSGALADLMLELDQASQTPRFEMRVQANVKHESQNCVVTLLGYPDLYFISKNGTPVIYDWKVNGYCGNSNTSPAKGHIMCRDGWDHEILDPSRSHGKAHKNCEIAYHQGIKYNSAMCLSEVDKSWANQTISYGWMLGEPVGNEFIIGIDQITKTKSTSGKPLLRIATMRHLATAEYQLHWFGQVANVWETIKSGHIFRHMTRKESDAQCKHLDNRYKAFEGDTLEDEWFRNTCRKQY